MYFEPIPIDSKQLASALNQAIEQASLGIDQKRHTYIKFDPQTSTFSQTINQNEAMTLNQMIHVIQEITKSPMIHDPSDIKTIKSHFSKIIRQIEGKQADFFQGVVHQLINRDPLIEQANQQLSQLDSLYESLQSQSTKTSLSIPPHVISSIYQSKEEATVQLKQAPIGSYTIYPSNTHKDCYILMKKVSETEFDMGLITEEDNFAKKLDNFVKYNRFEIKLRRRFLENGQSEPIYAKQDYVDYTHLPPSSPVHSSISKAKSEFIRMCVYLDISPPPISSSLVKLQDFYVNTVEELNHPLTDPSVDVKDPHSAKTKVNKIHKAWTDFNLALRNEYRQLFNQYVNMEQTEYLEQLDQRLKELEPPPTPHTPDA